MVPLKCTINNFLEGKTAFLIKFKALRPVNAYKDRTIRLRQHPHLYRILEDYAKYIQKKEEFLLSGRRGQAHLLDRLLKKYVTRSKRTIQL